MTGQPTEVFDSPEAKVSIEKQTLKEIPKYEDDLSIETLTPETIEELTENTATIHNGKSSVEATISNKLLRYAEIGGHDKEDVLYIHAEMMPTLTERRLRAAVKTIWNEGLAAPVINAFKGIGSRLVDRSLRKFSKTERNSDELHLERSSDSRKPQGMPVDKEQLVKIILRGEISKKPGNYFAYLEEWLPSGRKVLFKALILTKRKDIKSAQPSTTL